MSMLETSVNGGAANATVLAYPPAPLTRMIVKSKGIWAGAGAFTVHVLRSNPHP